jgi:hypothetical protein
MHHTLQFNLNRSTLHMTGQLLSMLAMAIIY